MAVAWVGFEMILLLKSHYLLEIHSEMLADEMI